MRIAFLDWLRIFAFTSVLIGHKFYENLAAAIANPLLAETPKILLRMLEPFVYGGGSGVVVFFMVSGYVITHVLQTEETSKFLIRRIFRIYPLYLTALVIQCLLIHFHTHEHPILFKEVLGQASLFGEVFHTPYSLGGVEWTLRVEIAFYIFMASIKMMRPNFIDSKWFVPLLALIVSLFSFLPPIPDDFGFSRDYFLLYSPFLFLGSAFYLVEKQHTKPASLWGLTAVVFIYYWHGLAVYQQNWISAHFAFLSFLLFAFAWYFRDQIKSGKIVLFFSNLTFSVYLFHNWLYDYYLSVTGSKKATLLLLFATCYLLYRCIEKPGIRIGKKVFVLLESKAHLLRSA